MIKKIIDNENDAIIILRQLKKISEDVAVFCDAGWGDSGQKMTYEIISDGNGQKPYARMTKQVFDDLRSKGYLAGNSLITYKARRLHAFIDQKEDIHSEQGDSLHRIKKIIK